MILLDTHILIWWLEGAARLSPRARDAIGERATALVSPISFWELAVLADRGRITVDREVGRLSRDLLASRLVEPAPFTPSIAVAAARLPLFHGDPADRFIYATARELSVPLISKDSTIRSYANEREDVEVIW
ncbi:MAG: type II toxin-antitoxin system VapC family toxin [Chloroflexota bacterium]